MMNKRLPAAILSSVAVSAARGGCGGGGGGDGGGGVGAGTVFPNVPAVTYDCVHKSSLGKDYEVGPGLEYATLGAVPWETLGPGDSVRIHATDQPYREKIVIAGRGTEADPIVVCGIPDTQGGTTRLPVIDGRDATTRPSLDYGNSGIEETSVVAVYNNKAASPGGKRPGYIEIANLQMQGATATAPFIGASGQPKTYAPEFVSALYVYGGDNITLVGNVFTDSSQGLYINSNDYLGSDGYDYAQSRDITIRGNSFENNGVPGSYYVHHAYTEAIGIVFEYNYFGRLKDYAAGNAISDRSVGTVIRYNHFDGGAHIAAIENPQDSWANVKTNLEKDPSLRRTFVYGNLIFVRRNPNVDTGDNAPIDQYNGMARILFMYGGTDQNYESYRNGEVFFYNNTAILIADETRQYNSHFVEVYTDPSTPLLPKVDIRNNIMVTIPETPGQNPTHFHLGISTNSTFGPGNMGMGDFHIENNWLPKGVEDTFPASEYYDPTTAHFDVSGNFEGGNPGFVDVEKLDLHLKAGAEVVDKGIALDPLAATAYVPEFEYVGPNEGKARDLHGTPMDLGCFEAP
jgi:hypothetical protein